MDSRQKPLLSICCLGYNHARYLHENIESICRIGYENIEIIVVDDGSQDESVIKLRELSNKVPYKMSVIAQKNTGNIGRNFNNAIKEARGDLISFISLDDVFNPEVILSEVEMMNQFENLAFVASSKTFFIGRGRVYEGKEELPLHNIENPSAEDLLNLEYTNFGSFYIQGSIFRKKIVDSVGGFDEDMTGDDIILRTKILRFILSSNEFDFRIIRQNSVFYRMHESNIHKNKFRQIKIVTEYLDKYWKDKPNPDILLDWIGSFIDESSYENFIEVFAINKRASSLLTSAVVKKRIKDAIIKENNLWLKMSKFIFHKSKFPDGYRQVTIFGIMNFSYRKKIKGRKYSF